MFMVFLFLLEHDLFAFDGLFVPSFLLIPLPTLSLYHTHTFSFTGRERVGWVGGGRHIEFSNENCVIHCIYTRSINDDKRTQPRSIQGMHRRVMHPVSVRAQLFNLGSVFTREFRMSSTIISTAFHFKWGRRGEFSVFLYLKGLLADSGTVFTRQFSISPTIISTAISHSMWGRRAEYHAPRIFRVKVRYRF